MRALRAADPRKWSRARLAEKFDCSNFFVGLVCKSREMGAEMKRAEEEARSKWGRKKREAMEDRKRRKATWGRDV